MTDDTTTSAVTVAEDEQEKRRKLAILRAVGLENVPPEQRELALAIANRYDLDLMLKHLVLVEGRPYITRDALLWVAHRSGHFDGIAVTEPTIKVFVGLGEFWYAEATVYRNDMAHPFTYGGRYPTTSGNKRYGPEMAIKVAECMALRRAFNVSASSLEERWDNDEAVAIATNVDGPQNLPQLVSERAAQVTGGNTPAHDRPQSPTTGDTQPEAVSTPPNVEPVAPAIVDGEVVEDIGQLPEPMFTDADVIPDPPAPDPVPEPAPKTRAKATPKPPTEPTQEIVPPMPAPEPPRTGDPLDVQCPEMSPYGGDARCRLRVDHKGAHRSSPTESWQ